MSLITMIYANKNRDHFYPNLLNSDSVSIKMFSPKIHFWQSWCDVFCKACSTQQWTENSPNQRNGTETIKHLFEGFTIKKNHVIPRDPSNRIWESLSALQGTEISLVSTGGQMGLACSSMDLLFKTFEIAISFLNFCIANFGSHIIS